MSRRGFCALDSSFKAALTRPSIISLEKPLAICSGCLLDGLLILSLCWIIFPSCSSSVMLPFFHNVILLLRQLISSFALALE